MSDSPRTTLSLWQGLQKTKCELAAANKRIAELEESRALLATECREWREEAMAAREKEEK